jgi:8-oxo-dGTP pyrophosphatase MutT (NUDIX family)
VKRREHLGKLLAAHIPADEREVEHLRRMRVLLAGEGDPFARDRFDPGHFTASAFVLDPDRSRLLFVHHAKLQRWLQPGGHIDPSDPDVIAAVRRELQEETGLVDLDLVGDKLLDVDVHVIPPRNGNGAGPAEPVHEHFDVRFVFHAASEELRPGSDALEARWVGFAEVSTLESDDSVRRAVATLMSRGVA